METAKNMYVESSDVRNTAKLEEWRHSVLVSAAEARKHLAKRHRVHRAMVSAALVVFMLAGTLVMVGVARDSDLLTTFGVGIRDVAKIAAGFVWFCGGLLTWLATRR